MFYIKQGSVIPSVSRTLRDESGQAIDLTGASVEFRLATLGHENLVQRECKIVDTKSGKVRYDWKRGETDEPGKYLVEWAIKRDGYEDIIPSDGFDYLKVVPNIGRS